MLAKSSTLISVPPILISPSTARLLIGGGTDKYLVANAYYAYSTRIVRDAADALGYAEEAKAYGDLYEKIVEAIHVEYRKRL